MLDLCSGRKVNKNYFTLNKRFISYHTLKAKQKRMTKSDVERTPPAVP